MSVSDVPTQGNRTPQEDPRGGAQESREMLLGIVGVFVALGQSLGWYRPAEGAGRVRAIVRKSLFRQIQFRG